MRRLVVECPGHHERRLRSRSPARRDQARGTSRAVEVVARRAEAGTRNRTATLQDFMNAADAVTLKPSRSGFAPLARPWSLRLRTAVRHRDRGRQPVTLRHREHDGRSGQQRRGQSRVGNGSQAPPLRSERKPLARLVPQGGWSVITLDLNGVTPEHLGFVRLSEVSIESVSLVSRLVASEMTIFADCELARSAVLPRSAASRERGVS